MSLGEVVVTDSREGEIVLQIDLFTVIIVLQNTEAPEEWYGSKRRLHSNPHWPDNQVAEVRGRMRMAGVVFLSIVHFVTS